MLVKVLVGIMLVLCWAKCLYNAGVTLVSMCKSYYCELGGGGLLWLVRMASISFLIMITALSCG